MNEKNQSALSNKPTFPNGVPLAALKSQVWQVDSAFSGGEKQYLMTEVDESSGNTLAMLTISIQPDRFVRISNIDTTIFKSKGFMRLLKHESKGFGFLSFSETLEISTSYNTSNSRSVSSSHDYALTKSGVILDPPGAPKLKDAIEVLSQQEFKLRLIKVVEIGLPKPIDTPSLLQNPNMLARQENDDLIQISTYVTPAPVYSKTVAVRVRSHQSENTLVFVKQTRSHFSKTEIDIAGGHPNDSFHYTRFDKTVGYETVCHYLGATGG